MKLISILILSALLLVICDVSQVEAFGAIVGAIVRAGAQAARAGSQAAKTARVAKGAVRAGKGANKAAKEIDRHEERKRKRKNKQKG